MRKDHSERNKKIIGGIMAFTMFGSLFTFIFFGFSGGGGSSGKIKYNGFELVDRGTHWSTEIDGRQAFFTYFPDDLGFVFVNLDIVNFLKNKVQIDVTSDFNDTYAQGIALAQYNMGLTMDNFNIFVRQGFTTPQPNFEVIKCEEATSFVPIIYFRSSNQTSVYFEGNCIVAEASSPSEFERIKDRLVYGIFGII
jgi:hypothetical protein